MDTNKALQILVQAVQLAQSKGAYTLDEAKILAEAIAVFVKKEEPKEELVKEGKKKKA